MRSSTDSMRVATTLALFAIGSAFVQLSLSAILGTGAVVSMCISTLSLPSPTSRTASASVRKFADHPVAAVAGVGLGLPCCLWLGFVLFISASRRGLGSWEDAAAAILGLVFLGLIPALLIQPLVIWLRRMTDLFADAARVDLIENAVAVEQLLRIVRLTALIAIPAAPMLPHLTALGALAIIPIALVSLGVSFTIFIEVRGELNHALAESLVREDDSFLRD